MTAIAHSIKRLDIADGIAGFSAPIAVMDAVTVEGSLLGGRNYARRGEELLPDVLAYMLDEGTRSRTKRDIQETLDRYGMTIDFSASGERLRFRAHCRRQHLPILFSVLAEELREPAFPPAELGIVRRRLIGGIIQSKEDTRAQGSIALSRLLYERGHPNFALTPEEAIRSLGKVTRGALRDFHAQLIGRGSLIIAAAGDLAERDLRILIRKSFGALGVARISARYARGGLTEGGGRSVVTIPKKTSVDLLLGVPLPIAKAHPDFFPLLIASRILGVPGFAGRLMKIVREEKGLTYALYARLAGFEAESQGHLEIAGSFAPELLAQGLGATLAVYRDFHKRGVSESEVADQKSMISGSHLIALSTTRGRAAAIRGAAEDGKAPAYLDEYLAEIAAVSVADVNRAIAEYLPPEKLAIAAAGSIAALPKVD